jgi:zinc protease
MVQINVIFNAGSSRDGKDFGLAQFANQLLDQGAGNLNADQIATQLDDVGAQYNNSVGRDMAIVSLQSLTDPRYLTSALTTFTTVLTAPTFPADAFTRTQQQTLSALIAQQEQPEVVAKNAFIKAVYPNQGYGHPTMGDAESIKKLTPEQLKQFYQQYYVAKNAVITMVGAVSRTQAEKIAQQITQNLPMGSAASALPKAMPQAQGVTQKIVFPSQQTTIIAGQVGISLQNPDYFPLMVGNYLLGGAPLTSLLFKEVREKNGLVYGISSGWMPLAANGPFFIGLQTRNDKASQALQLTQNTVQKFLKEGPSEAQLAQTKQKIVNGFPLTLVGNDAISGQLMLIGFYHLPLNYLDTYRDKVNAVTVAQIKQAYQKNLHPDRFVTVMVGNMSAKS